MDAMAKMKGRKVTLKLEEDRDRPCFHSTEHTLLDADEKTVVVEYEWPQHWDGKVGKKAKRYITVIPRKEIIMITAKMEENNDGSETPE